MTPRLTWRCVRISSLCKPGEDPEQHLANATAAVVGADVARPRYATSDGASDGPAPSLTRWGRAMQENIGVFVGLDASKMKITVALAEDGNALNRPMRRRQPFAVRRYLSSMFG